jgi:hypothetical protein
MNSIDSFKAPTNGQFLAAVFPFATFDVKRFDRYALDLQKSVDRRRLKRNDARGLVIGAFERSTLIELLPFFDNFARDSLELASFF